MCFKQDSGSTRTGTIGIVGPHRSAACAPRLNGAPAPVGPALVQATFTQVAKSTDPAAWNAFLRDGFQPNTAFAPVQASFNATAAANLAKTATTKSDGLELVFLQSPSVDDGRYANNSWLLETPDFVTKVTWDNAILVSPATALKLGIKANNFNILGDISEKLGNDVNYDLVADIVEISDGTTTIEAAAIVAPGHADVMHDGPTTSSCLFAIASHDVIDDQAGGRIPCGNCDDGLTGVSRHLTILDLWLRWFQTSWGAYRCPERPLRAWTRRRYRQ